MRRTREEPVLYQGICTLLLNHSLITKGGHGKNNQVNATERSDRRFVGRVRHTQGSYRATSVMLNGRIVWKF